MGGSALRGRVVCLEREAGLPWKGGGLHGRLVRTLLECILVFNNNEFVDEIYKFYTILV